MLSQQIKTLLYNSLIVPYINYCIMVWGFQTNRIIKLQKKALRIITLRNYSSHTEPLHKKLGMLKVDDILKLQHKFTKKCLRYNLPFLLNNIPTVVQEKLNTHSLQGFAQYTKLYFLQNYQDSCTRQNCYICMQH